MTDRERAAFHRVYDNDPVAFHYFPDGSNRQLRNIPNKKVVLNRLESGNPAFSLLCSYLQEVYHTRVFLVEIPTGLIYADHGDRVELCPFAVQREPIDYTAFAAHIASILHCNDQQPPVPMRQDSVPQGPHPGFRTATPTPPGSPAATQEALDRALAQKLQDEDQRQSARAEQIRLQQGHEDQGVAAKLQAAEDKLQKMEAEMKRLRDLEKATIEQAMRKSRSTSRTDPIHPQSGPISSSNDHITHSAAMRQFSESPPPAYTGKGKGRGKSSTRQPSVRPSPEPSITSTTGEPNRPASVHRVPSNSSGSRPNTPGPDSTSHQRPPSRPGSVHSSHSSSSDTNVGDADEECELCTLPGLLGGRW